MADSKPQEPLFAQVEFKGTIYVPEADYGDEFTVVLQGKVESTRGKLKDGEIVEIWGVKAASIKQLDIDPDAVLDASNADLMSQLVDFLNPDDLEDELAEVVSLAPQIEGQQDTGIAPPDGVDDDGVIDTGDEE